MSPNLGVIISGPGGSVRHRHSSPYTGRDRRHRTLSRLEHPSGQTFTVVSAAVLCCGVFVPLALAHVMAASTVQTDFVVLRILAALLISTAGLMSLIRWRMTGEAALGLSGSAAVLYGALGTLPAVMRLSVSTDDTSAMRAVNALLVVSLLAAALAAPPVASHVRTARLVVGGIVVAVACYGGIYHYTGQSTARLNGWLPLYVEIGLTSLWVGAATASFVKGRLLGQPGLTWLGLALMATAFAEAAQAAALTRPSEWLLSSGAVRAVGGAVWSFAAGRELLVVLADQSNSLLTLHDSLNVVSARLDEAQLRDQERRHDARAALCAVQAAVSTLSGYHDRLESDTRSGLERAVSAELVRLRHLLDSVEGAGDLVFFDLAAAIEPVVTTQRSNGMSIDLQVGSFCWVRGRPADTATVVQTLLDNARHYAAESPVTIRISRVDGRVVLAVEDQGPGVAMHERERIFERGVRGSGSARKPGSGLGLFIAARLMQDQFGDITVGSGLAGGACFLLSFPQAQVPRSETLPAPAAGAPVPAPRHRSPFAKASPVR